MTPLIDGDILAYEIGFGCEPRNQYGERVPVGIEEVNRRVDNKVKEICAAVWATSPPVIFFTGKGNFRDNIAKQKEYKGNRKSYKPFHHKYIRAYLMASYEHQIINGLEADDLMSIEQTARLSQRDTIICSRDKDLKTVEGFHYSWEVNKQPSFGPKWVDRIGEMELVGRKLKATGMRLFYSQILTGDSTDNIPGLPWCGPEKAYELLKDCITEEELFYAVKGAYEQRYKEDWAIPLLENGQLLWMTRELNEDGSPVLWEIPYGD